MKKSIALFSIATLMIVLSAFTPVEQFGDYDIYENGKGSKFKVGYEIGKDHVGNALWYKNTPTSEWSVRTVTYADEEMMKYTSPSGHKWSLIFNDDYSKFSTYKADGSLYDTYTVKN